MLKDGSRELFFRHRSALLAVNISQDDDGELQRDELPRTLFEGNYVAGFHDRPNYDVNADATRFVMVQGGQELTAGYLMVHLHFRRELEEAFPREGGNRP